MEDREQLKESRLEFDQQIKESRLEFDRQMKESGLKFDRQIKEMNRRFGDFSNRFGEVVEYLVAPNLQKKFSEMGYDFQEASKNHKLSNKKHNISLEIDIFLQNGDTAMLVEIKTNLTDSDINEHVKRLEKMRKYADLRGDKRKFLGAVAGVVVASKTKKYALNQGFYFVEPSGETFNITSPPGKPKEW